MHPPEFRPDHQRLSDWPACWLEVRCPCSPRTAMLPVRLLIERHGDRLFRRVLDGRRCSACKGPPAPVYLIAGTTRRFGGGPLADWSIELVRPLAPQRTGLPLPRLSDG